MVHSFCLHRSQCDFLPIVSKLETMLDRIEQINTTIGIQNLLWELLMRHFLIRASHGASNVWFSAWEWYYSSLETLLASLTRKDAS